MPIYEAKDSPERKPKGNPTMTGHQINSLVGDLVAMAQAMERLPQVEHERDEAQRIADHRSDTIQSLELRIIDLKAEIDGYHSTIRELEVAKDAAETMFLEADDRTARALEFVKAQFGAAGSLIQALEPPRAEPVVERAVWHGDLPKDEPQPEPIISEVKPIADPLLHSEEQSKQHTPSSFETQPTAPYTSLEHGEGQSLQGQSEPGPIPTAAISTEEAGSAQSSVTHLESVSSGTTTEPSPTPYSNKRYYDHPIYVSPDDWLAGGGTEADYHWRPSHDYGKAFPL